MTFDRANDASADNVAQRPDVVPGRSYESAVTGRVDQYIDPTAFQLPPENSYGNSGRNVLEGPGLVTFDLGLFKNTNIGERVRLQFRAEAFNLLNKTNFATPSTLTSNSTGFGVFTSTFPPRQIQLALKLYF